MRSRPEHAEAVARRLALLRAELGLSDPAPHSGPDPSPDPSRDSALELVLPQPPDAVPDAVPRVPEVGRHASRRTPALPGRGIGPLRVGSVGFGPWHLVVIAGLISVGLAVTCWLVVRSAPDEITVAPVSANTGALAPAPQPAPIETPVETPVGDGAAVTGPGATSGDVVVDVAGKVRRPGIAVLPAGSRVVDAIKAAGGARPGVSLTDINLARVLVDGEQILVGLSAPVVPNGGGTSTASPTDPAGPVNLNTATLEQLDSIPEVGPVTAQAILDWRTETGGFTSIDQLLEIDGIGPATLEKITPHVTV